MKYGLLSSEFILVQSGDEKSSHHFARRSAVQYISFNWATTVKAHHDNPLPLKIMTVRTDWNGAWEFDC